MFEIDPLIHRNRRSVVLTPMRKRENNTQDFLDLRQTGGTNG